MLQSNQTISTAQEIDTYLDDLRLWVDRLNKTLICKTDPGPDIVSPDAHEICRLGRWLLSDGIALFHDNAFHTKLLAKHRLMHDQGRDLVLRARDGAAVTEQQYDDFLTTYNDFSELLQEAHDGIVASVNATDPLTGAQNRSFMRVHLLERIERSADPKHPAWLIMVDLDHFKVVNDKYGHAVGDLVLKGFAGVVRDHIRADDLFFRYGGEEFLLCISGADRERIELIAERLRVAIAEEWYPSPDGEDFQVTASFGVVQLRPSLGVNDAINMADAAMYAAKRAGRNQVKIQETVPA